MRTSQIDGLQPLCGPGSPMHVGWASEVHDATNKERHVCGRPRVGERAVSSDRQLANDELRG